LTDADDRRAVADLLGREPAGSFEVVVRHEDGSPLVIANAPLLDDGTPMPTRYWLVGEPERAWVGRLESERGVNRAEGEVEPEALLDAHRRYAQERDALLPAHHTGPRPFGGVGGTRVGVKCLHAHFAWWLAGGRDPVGQWVADHLAAVGNHPSVAGARTVAAIDCGTNSTRLLVRRGLPGGNVVSLDRRMQITRLGQGVDATGSLAPEAIDRTVAVLHAYRAAMDELGVIDVRATATSAARDADNRDRFFDAARDAIGVPFELLSGDEEGALSFAGATADLRHVRGTALVVDLGGGSTELVSGRIGADGTPEVIGVESLDVGCVRITERYLTSDPPTPDELARASEAVSQRVAGGFDRVRGARDANTLIGLAGTVSTLASIDHELAEYSREMVHHHRMPTPRILELVTSLTRMSTERRRQVVGMEAARAEVIVGGLVVLEAVLMESRAPDLLVSESDILDGLVASRLH
jgi:exopolyphosphatase/guanosine-5'-triphosphate,3'-diphosphate pyrophosphatase